MQKVEEKKRSEKSHTMPGHRLSHHVTEKHQQAGRRKKFERRERRGRDTHTRREKKGGKERQSAREVGDPVPASSQEIGRQVEKCSNK